MLGGGDSKILSRKRPPADAGRSKIKRRLRRSVRPAALAFRAEMVAGRAEAIGARKRMAMAARAAPESRAAAFRNLDNRAVGTADRSRRNSGAGGADEPKSQCSTQCKCSNHSVFSRLLCP